MVSFFYFLFFNIFFLQSGERSQFELIFIQSVFLAHESRVDCGSNAIPVHHITAISAKLHNWLIREAEETFENNIRSHIKKAIGNGDPMKRVNYQISVYPPHENRKIERERNRHQISGGVRNLDKTKDGTNKMRDMSKRPN